MSMVRRVIGAVAVALVAVLGLLVLSQSASALTRDERCYARVAPEAKLVEERVTPECPPGLGWTRVRNVELPSCIRELHRSLADGPCADDPSPARAPRTPHAALRPPCAALLQVFRC
ncbi:hypothetical protein [Kitasatospora aureofaciens]|uniref:hypothetical protein n=1 Tax=Kitasatospora aureofaciens TaxID=1894 RepID=UPI001C44CE16|nr:hypothetical protein [Kitasatospora aureofaciens]MBV6699712.1 hypothetical protein [Kitasatospora aureofaciens]